MPTPQVSVIIPTFNRASYLPRAIQSVLKQKYNHFELLIVDDGSTDDTKSVIAPFMNQGVKYLKLQKNFGVSYARNMGVAETQSPWVAFLDSDDEWHSNKLEEQMAAASKDPLCRFIHCDEIWVRNGQRVNPHKKHKKYGGRIFEHCLPLCCVSPSASLMHRSLFNECGGFRTDYPVCEDYDLWLKIFSKYEAIFIDKPLLTKYGGHEDQLSRKFFAMDYWRIKSLKYILENHSHYLTTDELVKTQKMFIKKKIILLKGCLKHNRKVPASLWE